MCIRDRSGFARRVRLGPELVDRFRRLGVRVSRQALEVAVDSQLRRDALDVLDGLLLRSRVLPSAFRTE